MWEKHFVTHYAHHNWVYYYFKAYISAFYYAYEEVLLECSGCLLPMHSVSEAW